MGICPLLVGPNLLKDQIITVLPPTELQLPLAAKAISSLKPKLAPPLSFTTRCRQTQQQLLSFTSGFSCHVYHVVTSQSSSYDLHLNIALFAESSCPLLRISQRVAEIATHSAGCEYRKIHGGRFRAAHHLLCRCRCSKHSLFFPKLTQVCLLRNIFWQYLDNFSFLYSSLITILSLFANNVVG